MFFHEDREITKEALNNCLTFITDVCDVLLIRDLIFDAFLNATKYSITVYDALFLAAGQKRTIPFLTMDAKLYQKLKSTEDVVLIS